MPYFVYILRSIQNKLYIGQTNNLEKRQQYHRSGHGAQYADTHKTTELVHVEQFASRAEAMRRESQIKRWSRVKKEALIASDYAMLKKL